MDRNGRILPEIGNTGNKEQGSGAGLPGKVWNRLRIRMQTSHRARMEARRIGNRHGVDMATARFLFAYWDLVELLGDRRRPGANH